ncbi:efflux RND transporter periplasmic adaptor subunit [Pseudomarimonas salicorniae]|uniref:HlyD family efflux transporter periplasmic adaptor subunit n=1 Tax=Pseudomarimonas salicorniae TaxID=2933270 RepID=A0ABT0GHL4_9GAMM|nr:HlyD family efflux transporter periplasmic adaptor subunit [Lysobacter sp. CAU 1642]MCK7593532.1 HlyD family efflux transporter periplasmic adaptor subunit [Lysobacter sp. CAU 1642]
MDIQRIDRKRQKQIRRWGLGLLGGLATLGLLAWLATLDPAAPSVDKASLWTDTVKRGEMLREVRGPGVLVPKEIRWIAADTPARVERIIVRPGASVQPDTVIMELSNPEVIDQALAAEAALAAAEADYTARVATLQSQLLDQRALQAQVTAEYESARLQAEAEGELAKKGIIPSIQFRRSQLNAEQLKGRVAIEAQRIDQFKASLDAQLAADRARIAQLKNAAQLRRRQADALNLRAGIAGVLQQVPVQEGQQVAPGTNLARVARPGELMAELRIPETQIKDVVLGQGVRVDTRNGVVAGNVTRIDPAVQNGAVLVDVELSGELPSGARPDLSVDGIIEIERLPDVLFVGRPAYGQPESDVRLFRIDPDSGLAQRVPVRLGRASVSVIEVQQGLAPGDQIILSDTSQWDDYDRLRIN